jgi:glycosyltransferase involved in cell wall biosynthesis
MKMCQAFADNGHEVVLLAPNIKNKYEENIVDVYEYYGVKKNFEIKKLWHPDIIGGAIIYTLSIFFYLLFTKNFNLVYGRFLQGCYVATFLRNRVIFESHESILDMKKLRYFVFKQLIKSKSFEKLTVISQALKNIYLEKKFLNNIKIQVAHDGADEVKDLNNKVKLFGSEENLKVGYVGHLYKGKGMEIINSIAGKLNDEVDFHVIGGTERDINFWKKEIKHKNVFFYGHISHKEVSNYIDALDICLLPNQKIVRPHGGKHTKINISGYTSPLKLFEYMSHKKPIIASDFPVIREVLNEKNSILVDCDDIEGWVSSIQKLRDLKNREVIANQALNNFYKFSWKNRAANVIEN